MKINAITPTSYLIRVNNNEKVKQNSSIQKQNNTLPNYEAILPLKNQILFKGEHYYRTTEKENQTHSLV